MVPLAPGEAGESDFGEIGLLVIRLYSDPDSTSQRSIGMDRLRLGANRFVDHVVGIFALSLMIVVFDGEPLQLVINSLMYLSSSLVILLYCLVAIFNIRLLLI